MGRLRERKREINLTVGGNVERIISEHMADNVWRRAFLAMFVLQGESLKPVQVKPSLGMTGSKPFRRLAFESEQHRAVSEQGQMSGDLSNNH